VTAPEGKQGLTRNQTLILLALVAAFGVAIYYFATRDTSITTASGLKYEVLEQGAGEKPQKGQTVQVNYTGTLKKTGEKFDSSYDRGQTFDFKLGEGAVIKGWDEALADMKVGERRRLTIPPKLAYGANGQPPKIGPNATLVFDVKLEGIKK
jgi:peptidylprolyl isomerase